MKNVRTLNLVLIVLTFVLTSRLVIAELHLDTDTGKWIKEGFDIRLYAQIPNTQGTIRMAFGNGGAFGYDMYVTAYPGRVYRVSSTGQATLVGQTPTKVQGMAFPNSGSSFGDYIYLGSADGYYEGNRTIYRMDSNGNVNEFFSGNNFQGGTLNSIAFAPAGSLYGDYLFTQDDSPDLLYRIAADGSAATFSSGIKLAADFMFDVYGQFDNQLIVSNIEKSEHGSGINALYKVAPDGSKTTLLGDVFHMGGGVITPPDSIFGGKLFLAENDWASLPTDLYEIGPDGSYSIFAQGFDFSDCSDVVYGPDGALYVTDWQSGSIYQIVPEPATLLLFGLGGLVVRKRVKGKR